MRSDSLTELARLERFHRLGIASSSLASFLEVTADDPTGYRLSPIPIDRTEALTRVGPGWANLIVELYDEIEQAAMEMRTLVAVVRLRRVAGRLEIKVLPEEITVRLVRCLERIRRQAARSCEQCGRRGYHRAHVWGDAPAWPLGFTACQAHCTRADYDAIHALYRVPAKSVSDKATSQEFPRKWGKHKP
jgi:hypothetical protein